MRAKSIMTFGLLAMAFGCGEREAAVETAPLIVDRARLGNELVFVDLTHAEVDALDVTAKEPAPRVARIPVRANPRYAVERKNGASHTTTTTPNTAGTGTVTLSSSNPLGIPSPEGSGPAPDEILVLSDGSRDALGEYQDRPTLTAIDRKHEVRHYELSQPMAHLRLSGDGRYAILWGQPAHLDADSLLRNPNRVALVDLDEAPSKSNPAERTLKATGGDISDVLLTPPLQISSGTRPLALFSFGNGLGVWDITDTDREDITAEGLSQGKMQLKRVVADVSDAKLYLVQEGLADLRVLSFLPTEDSTASNNFTMSLNQLPLALVGASDMIPYSESGISKLLVTTGTKLTVVDADDSRATSVALATRAEHLHSFDGRAPDDATVKQRVLAWGVNQTKVSFVELASLEKAGTKNIEELSLGYPVTELVSLPGNLMLAVLASNGVGIIELETRRFQRLASSMALTSPLIEADAQRIWVSVGDRVGYFEPSALATGSMRLDETAEEMFLFEDADQCRIVVAHDSPVGHVTIVDGEKVTRATARALAGFLVDGLVK